MSAGTENTPKLLMLSGIGLQEELKKLQVRKIYKGYIEWLKNLYDISNFNKTSSNWRTRVRFEQKYFS